MGNPANLPAPAESLKQAKICSETEESSASVDVSSHGTDSQQDQGPTKRPAIVTALVKGNDDAGNGKHLAATAAEATEASTSERKAKETTNPPADSQRTDKGLKEIPKAPHKMLTIAAEDAKDPQGAQERGDKCGKASLNVDVKNRGGSQSTESMSKTKSTTRMNEIDENGGSTRSSTSAEERSVTKAPEVIKKYMPLEGEEKSSTEQVDQQDKLIGKESGEVESEPLAGDGSTKHSACIDDASNITAVMANNECSGGKEPGSDASHSIRKQPDFPEKPVADSSTIPTEGVAAKRPTEQADQQKKSTGEESGKVATELMGGNDSTVGDAEESIRKGPQVLAKPTTDSSNVPKQGAAIKRSAEQDTHEKKSTGKESGIDDVGRFGGDADPAVENLSQRSPKKLKLVLPPPPGDEEEEVVTPVTRHVAAMLSTVKGKGAALMLEMIESKRKPAKGGAPKDEGGRNVWNGTPIPSSPFDWATTANDDVPRRKKVARKLFGSRDMAEAQRRARSRQARSSRSKKSNASAASKKPKVDTTNRLPANEIWCGPPDEKIEGGWPKGWMKRVFQRQSGASKGSTDRYWYTPERQRKLRSMKEVKRFMGFLKENGGNEDAAWAAFRKK